MTRLITLTIVWRDGFAKWDTGTVPMVYPKLLARINRSASP